MFGKWMNNYYYGKSGKGDYRKEDLPTNRWQLFWEMLRVRFSALIRLNLMYVVVWLPTMIVMMMGVMSLLTGLTESADDATIAMTAVELFQSISMSTLLLLVPCITLTGVATPGVCYVTRNWARDEHAFIWSDFKDAIKANWKQSLVVSLITSLMPLIVYVCWQFYGQMAQNNAFLVVPQVLVLMIGVIWALSVTYFHPLIVTYQLKMRDVFRNGILLAIARLPMSVGMRLLHCLPVIIAVALAFFVNPLWCVMGIFLYYFIIGFSLSRFVTASFTNGVFDKFINSRIEGAVVGRGLNTEVDDDDDEDEEADTEE